MYDGVYDGSPHPLMTVMMLMMMMMIMMVMLVMYTNNDDNVMTTNYIHTIRIQRTTTALTLYF